MLPIFPYMAVSSFILFVISMTAMVVVRNTLSSKEGSEPALEQCLADLTLIRNVSVTIFSLTLGLMGVGGILGTLLGRVP